MAIVELTAELTRDSTGLADKRPWYVYAASYTGGSDGVVTTKRSKPIYPVASTLTIRVEAGIVAYIEDPDNHKYLVDIPETDGDLWGVIQAGVAYPPETPQQLLEAAISASLEANQISESVASLIANPETSAYDVVVTTATSALSNGAPGLTKTVDARENLSTARPVGWLGNIVWLVNEGDSTPTNIQDGDMVWPVAVEELPWTPQYLPNKVAWWDAQALSVADGVGVASWPDLSGNGNNLAQATAGFQPVMDSDKINGHPAVVADGVDDRLFGSLAVTYVHPFTIYAVAGTDVANITTLDYLYDGRDGAATIQRSGFSRSDTEQYTATRGSFIQSSASAWTTGPKLIRTLYNTNGSTSTIDVNGVEVATGNLSSGATIVDFTMFCRGDAQTAVAFPGYIGELLIVQGEPSPENETLLFDYFNERWGLGL